MNDCMCPRTARLRTVTFKFGRLNSGVLLSAVCFDVAVSSSGCLYDMAVRTAVALRTHCNLQHDDLYFVLVIR